ncbi:MAG: PAS domain-containing methyl-accepting chemotaxis protein [Dyella sp.]
MYRFLRFFRAGAARPRYGELRAQVQAANRSQAIVAFNLDGIVLDVNQPFLDAMGYRREQVVGQHHRMFVSPEEQASDDYRQFWDRLRQGKHDTGVYRRLGADDREVWLQASYTPVLDRQGRAYKVIKHASDITDRQRHNAEMNGRLAAIDKAQAVIEFSLEGIVLAANDNFLACMGYQREEVIGQHHRLFVEPAERDSVAYRQFWQKLGQGQHDAALYRRLGKGGREVWIQASYNPIFDQAGRPFKVIKYATDVTAQTRAAHTLRLSLASLSQSVPAIAAQARSADQMAIDANRSATDGGALMRELIATMDSVNDSAQRMTEIIGVIDALAFQTNILAINAAVESAHAGQHGRGFGVVAQEVRALAQRSAESAKDIRRLIEDTVERINDGSSRAQLAGSAMRTIVGLTNSVNQRVEDIAAAAAAQANDIDQVGRAMAQLRINQQTVAA